MKSNCGLRQIEMKNGVSAGKTISFEIIEEKCQIVPLPKAEIYVSVWFQQKIKPHSSFLTRYRSANFFATSTLASIMPANSKRGLEKIAFARMWPMRPLPTSRIRAGWRRAFVGEMNVMVTILVGREGNNIVSGKITNSCCDSSS